MRIAFPDKGLLIILGLLLFLSGCETATRLVFSPGRSLVPPRETVTFPFQEVWFEASDTTRLHGWFVPSETAAPLVLFFHGNAASISHRIPNLAYLQQLGLNVFIFDYRGFGESEGLPLREEDLYRDARGALNWLEANGWEAHRLIYYGRSMGATVALQMALESPPAGLILECPFTSLPDLASRTHPLSYGLVGRWLITDRFDNKKKTSLLATPVLFFHGKKDRIVPYRMSEKLFSLAKEPKALYLIEGAGHSDCYLVGGEDYKNAWLNFLAHTTNHRSTEPLAEKQLSRVKQDEPTGIEFQQD